MCAALAKGRKTRCIPLRKEVVVALRHWLQERNGQPADAVFTNTHVVKLSVAMVFNTSCHNR